MKKIVVAGHVCIDITPVFPAGKRGNMAYYLQPGKLLHMDGVSVCTGGTVSNTGLALKRLGADVTLLGKVGCDAFGDLVEDIFKKEGAGGLLRDPKSSTSYTVVLAMPGIDRIFLHDPGANDTFVCDDVPDEALEGAALFHFGYPPIMRRMFLNGGEETEKLLRRVKEKEIATCLDLAAVDPEAEAGQVDWEALLARVLPYTDFFVPSFEELCFMLNRPLFDRMREAGGDMTQQADLMRDAMPLVRKSIEMGAGAVMLKCGTAGMVYCTADEARMRKTGAALGLDTARWANRSGIQRCFKADIVRSATGAGDTSIAAFLMAMTEGRAPEECVRLAAAEGACAVTSYDTLGGLKTLAEIEDRIRSGWKES